MGNSNATSNRRRLIVAVVIVGAFLVVEVAGAYLTGSLALFADAGHVFSDVVGLIVALVATVVASKPPTARQTFGFQRAEVFGAAVNGLILTAVSVFVAVEGIQRLVAGEGAHVLPLPMLIVAAIGLVVNIVAALLLREPSSASINLKGAYLEVVGDLIGSIVVIVAAVAILVTGFEPADAIASLVIAALIVPRALLLLRDVVRVLSESAPVETDVAAIRKHILEAPGVTAVHDVHVWSITSGAPVFSAHVVADPAVFRDGGTGQLLDALTACLSDHFDVAHSTFQLEPAEHAAHEDRPHA